MASYLFEWLSLFFRWFHVIAGVAWIGASFYFIWLDNSLEEPPQWKKDKGIKGDLWAIHGGGFYEVAKYQLGPQAMPKHLHWFKWEAYTTWLTGAILLWIVYYLGADRYLIDPSRYAWSTTQAIGLGIGFICFGFIFYEIVLRTPLKENGKAFGALLYIFMVIMTWIACHIFSPRGAFIHVGALIGTIMAGNVLLGIMPAQRGLVAAVIRGESPDPRLGEFAKLRSTHNNYFTLPLIFIMISNHYPITYTHEYNWLVLSAIGFITAFARHFFNLRHRGIFKPAILVIAFMLFIGLIVIMAPPVPSVNQTKDGAEVDRKVAVNDHSLEGVTEVDAVNLITEQQALRIVQTRCAGCHAQQPNFGGFMAAPAGIKLETVDQIVAQKAQVIQVTQSQYMPLGNMTQMTHLERNALIAWLETQ